MGPPHARTPQNKSRAESSVTTHEADVCLQKWVGGVGVGAKTVTRETSVTAKCW